MKLPAFSKTNQSLSLNLIDNQKDIKVDCTTGSYFIAVSDIIISLS